MKLDPVTAVVSASLDIAGYDLDIVSVKLMIQIIEIAKEKGEEMNLSEIREIKNSIENEGRLFDDPNS